ncbi:MAG: hypothetical protein VR70_11065 [Rhodospirillaceae bacterium BRH_c57]|nr:MAG: hypothetical protein VR70_11065 [Rhodospirillaceae bacterium BRH_c57]
MQESWQQSVLSSSERIAKELGDGFHPETLKAALVAACEDEATHQGRLARARELCEFGARLDKFADRVIAGGCQAGIVGARAIQAGLDDETLPDALEAVASEYENTVRASLVISSKSRNAMHAALEEVAEMVRDECEAGLFAGKTEQETKARICMEMAVRRTHDMFSKLRTATMPCMSPEPRGLTI